jgi:hypothetical protein
MGINHDEIRTFEQINRKSMETLRQESSRILDQLTELAGTLTDEQFTRELPVLLNYTIGKHFRHIMEFYGAMFEGFQSGRINYHRRKHDAGIEQNRITCIDELGRLKHRLLEPIWQEPLELSGSYSMDSDDEFALPTNAERELVNNIEHAIHHMAIIRIAVQHEYPDLPLRDEFGFATSTLKYLRNK